MNRLRIRLERGLPILLFLPVFMLTGNGATQAKDLPSDPCTLLAGAQLQKVLEQSFGSPAKTTAPAARFDNVAGTDCTYQSEGGAPHKLLFRIYVDPSTAVAKDTFDKLSAFYGPNTLVTGSWDKAYVDAKHAIHVQKGEARYYLNLSPVGQDTAKVDKQLKDLATSIAGRL
jgi:hypothetical protein